MKKHYELVCVVDARLSVQDIQKQVKTIESHLGGTEKDKDDMWLLPLAYPLAGQDQAYFVSYHLELESEMIPALKRELLLEKGVLKFHLFSMKPTEPFLKFADLKKAYLATLPEKEEKEDDDTEEAATEEDNA